MYYLIYKTTSKSGKYYIGRHSTNILEDGYIGSGKWVRSIKDKSELTREILELCENEDLLKHREEIYLKEHIGSNDCMNFNYSSCGFSSGELNPSCRDDIKKKTSDRVKGNGNPAKNPETARKIAESNKYTMLAKGKWAKPMSDQGKHNISKGRTGIKYSENGKALLKENRANTYKKTGKTPHIPDWTGKKHSDETKLKMKLIADSILAIECPHCGKSAKPGPYARWHGEKCKNKFEDSVDNK